MRISQIDTNFRHTNGLTCAFNRHRGVIVLAGANGAGKTSILNALALAAFNEAYSDAKGAFFSSGPIIAEEGLPAGQTALTATVAWSTTDGREVKSDYTLKVDKKGATKVTRDGLSFGNAPHAAVTDILRRNAEVLARDMAGFVIPDTSGVVAPEWGAPLKAVMARAQQRNPAVWFEQALNVLNVDLKSEQSAADAIAHPPVGVYEVTDEEILAADEARAEIEATIKGVGDNVRAWARYNESMGRWQEQERQRDQLVMQLAQIEAAPSTNEARARMLDDLGSVIDYFVRNASTPPKVCPCCWRGGDFTIGEAEAAKVRDMAVKARAADETAAATARKRTALQRSIDALDPRCPTPPDNFEQDADDVAEGVARLRADAAHADARVTELRTAKAAWLADQRRIAALEAKRARIEALKSQIEQVTARRKKLVEDALDDFIARAKGYMPDAEALGGRTLVVDLRSSRPFVGLEDADGNRFKPCGGEWQAIVVAFACAGFERTASPILLPDINWGASLLTACAKAWCAYPGVVVVQTNNAPEALDSIANVVRLTPAEGKPPTPTAEPVAEEAPAVVEGPPVITEDVIEDLAPVAVAVDWTEEDMRGLPRSLFAPRHRALTAQPTKPLAACQWVFGPAGVEHLRNGGAVWIEDANGKSYKASVMLQTSSVCINHTSLGKVLIGGDSTCLGKFEAVGKPEFRIIAIEKMADIETAHADATARIRSFSPRYPLSRAKTEGAPVWLLELAMKVVTTSATLPYGLVAE